MARGPAAGTASAVRRLAAFGRSRTGVALLIVGAAAAGAWARPRLAAVRAAWTAPGGPAQPLSAPLWRAKTEEFRALSGSAGRGALVMVYVGDSITDWANLDEYLDVSGVRILNRGISGDTTAGIAARLGESVPAGSRVCFLMAGYNDIALGEPVEATADRLIDAAVRLRRGGRVRHVVVESVPPPGNEHDQAIAALNARLASRLRAEPDVTFLDLTPVFGSGGSRDPQLFAAGVHLSPAGVRRRLRAGLAHVAALDPEVAAAGLVVDD